MAGGGGSKALVVLILLALAAGVGYWIGTGKRVPRIPIPGKGGPPGDTSPPPQAQPSDGFATGKRFRLTRGLPLTQVSDSADSSGGVKKIRFINAGGVVTILERRKRGGTVYFRVSAAARDGKDMGEGWIKGPALAAQNPKAVTEGEQAPKAAKRPARRKMTLIGVIEKDESDMVTFTPEPDEYRKEQKPVVYVLENEAAAREALKGSGGASARVILIGVVEDDAKPPRIKVESVRPFKKR